MAVRIIGQTESLGADVETDPWIPLKVSWWPRGQEQPLYLRISGTAGGEVELKVRPEDGALLQVIVIDEPPRLDSDPRESSLPAAELTDTRPVVDRSYWDLSAAFRPPTFIECSELAFFEDGEVQVLRLSSQPTRKRLHSQGVTVWVGDDQCLAIIEARTT